MSESASILLVDFDQTSALRIASEVQSLGCSVITAPSAEEALEIFAESGKEISHVVIEMDLPDMYGPELFSRLLLVRPGLNVAYTSRNPRIAGLMTRHGYTFIEKPLEGESLAVSLKQFIVNAMAQQAAK